MLTSSSALSNAVRFGAARRLINRKDYVRLSHRRKLSEVVEGNVHVEASLESTSSISKLREVARHGAGDSVIVLDVGGKEFKTLRSTIAGNRVLCDIVAAAEAEFTQGGKAIFIDRDPTHFGLILQHLRNKVDGLSYHGIGRYIPSEKIADATVQLPTDKTKLRDIYMESTYYDIKELQHSACGQSILAWFFENVRGKNSNPFDEATKLLTRLKRGLIASVGFVGITNTGSLLDRLPDSVKSALLPEVKILGELAKGADQTEKKKDS